MHELVIRDNRVQSSVTGMLLSEQRGGMTVQSIILIVALALGAAGAFRTLKGGLERRPSCAAETIQSMSVGGRCGEAPLGAPPAAPIAAGPAGPGPGGGAPPAGPAFTLVGNEQDGPALGESPTVDALPFPGTSVVVSCTAVRNPDTACKDRTGVRVQVSGEVTIERSPTKLDVKNGGCPLQELSISGKVQVELSGKFKGKQVGGSLAVFAGEVRKFTIKVSPDQADAIERGERQPPNPIDPTTLLPGESIELSEEFFTGNKLQGTFRQLQVEMGFEEGRKLSVGVKRIDASTVRIFVGDASAVRNSLAVGGSEGDVTVSVGNKEELARTNLRTVEIDISTPEGHAAYQEFLATGKLPPPNAPGTKNAATTEAIDFTDTTRLEGKFKQVKVGGVVADAEGVATETKKADGSSETVVASRKNDVGFAIKESRDASGQVTGTNFTLLLEGADRKNIENFEKATGKSLGADASGNVRLDFSEADLENIRQQAIDQVHKAAQQRGIDISRAELERLLREDPNKLRRAGLGTHPSFEIAAAQTPAEVLQQLALFGGPTGDPNRVLDNLNAFASNTAAVRHGRGARPRDHADSAFPGTPDPDQCTQ